jgi:sterol 3beta-glucosyltransferase
MRITIFAVGDRDALDASAVLGTELDRRGHNVILVAPDTPTTEPTTLELFVNSAAGAEVVVSTAHTLDEASCLAEAAGVPMVALLLEPGPDQSAFSRARGGGTRLPRPLARVLQNAQADAEWAPAAPRINAFRARLGLAPTSTSAVNRMRRAGTVEIQAYSRLLVPALVTWDERRPLVGFVSDAEAPLPTGAWVGGDEIFVDVALGPAVHDAVERVAARSGDRVVRGRADRVRLDEARMAVHPGTAATTGAVARGGIPSMVLSETRAQAFWGRSVRDRGVGDWLELADLADEALERAIRPLLGAAPRRRAADLRTALLAETAVADSVQIIEDAVSAPASRSRPARDVGRGAATTR